jgi:hypothetical protein
MKLLALKICPYEEWLKGEFWTTFEPDYGLGHMPWTYGLLCTSERQYNGVFSPMAKPVTMELASRSIRLVRHPKKPIQMES